TPSNATMTATTQAASTVIARNPANNTSITALAGRDGTFELELPLVPGDNQIQINVTDPAGNASQKILALKQGSIKMRVRLTSSLYQIRVSHHPSSLQLTVLVTDPKGNPLPGARAFFTLQIPGLAPISNQIYTGIDGRARFTTPLVGTIQTGTGTATVLVSHDVYGDSTDRIALT